MLFLEWVEIHRKAREAKANNKVRLYMESAWLRLW